MSPHAPASTERAVEAAMAQVLAAEAAARDSVAQAQSDAQQSAERSRAAVRALLERTQHRIRCLRTAFERATDAEVAALQTQADALTAPHAPAAAEEAARIGRAVARVATQLTGATP